MAILLNEYCNFIPVNKNLSQKNKFKMQESESFVSNFTPPQANTLMVEVEGIHAYPYHTRNFTRYMPEALKRSQKKWTYPYLKPLIKHHNDENGKIIGRIYDATWVESTALKDIGGLIFTVSVPDKEAAEDVENRLLETVSIGVSANDVRCSICGSHIIDAEEGCPNNHDRGAEYDGEICYWDIYDIDPKELSYVIVPSDAYAKNIRVYKASEQRKKLEQKITESLKENTDSGGKNPKMDLQQQLDEALKKIEELEQQIQDKTTLASEVDRLKLENDELTSKIDEIKNVLEDKNKALEEKEKALEDKENELTAIKDTVAQKDQDIQDIRAEVEASENVIMEAKENYRNLVQENVNLYRTILNKTVLKEEELKARSLDSLKDALTDLKEEAKEKNVLKIVEQAGKLDNPAFINPSETKKDNEDKGKNNINLAEGLEEIFSKII